MYSVYFIWGFLPDKVKTCTLYGDPAQLFLRNKYTVYTMGCTVHSSPVPHTNFFYKRRATDLQLQKLQGPTPENPLKIIVQIVANQYLHPKKVYSDIFENKKFGFIK